jgi:hypothetical protein
MDNNIVKYALGALALFLVFLPSIIAETRGRMALVFAAFILSILPVALVGMSFVGGGLLGLSVLPIAGGLWMAGLFCGLAAWIDARLEKRNRETVLRLLTNDARGLGEVEDYQPSRFLR